ncbi:MAG: hypothetical protein AYL29_010060 [Candidatus Bathyarchaeota archaeon B24]|nr:MAG: hypothetical protein AYL29_010060 [Candidatus Bathyarchaeota archaeon B24]RLI24758.1 MAG: hypothetical protein DRO57_05850 [Candidatus Bathyarchaeota archaeon]
MKMRMKARKTVLLSLTLVLISSLGMAQPSLCQTDIGLEDLLSELLSQPVTMASFIVKFCLGLMLGYFSVKAIKYVLALVGVMAVGVILDIWQLGGLEEFISKIGLEWSKVYPLIQSLISAFSILTVLPIGLGFFIGFIVAVRR